MKKNLLSALLALSLVGALAGCLNLQLGGGTTAEPATPSVGQQLMDLKKAKDAGALSDEEYQSQRAKILGQPCPTRKS